MFIGFDGLPYSAQWDPYYDTVPLSYALPPTQYADAIFSSSPGYHVATYGRPYGTFLPSITRASDFNNYANHFVSLIVDFPKPVTDLTFVVTGADNFGVIGAIEIYQNNVYTRTESLFGNGNPYSPAIQYAASTYANVTRIVVNRITDPNGIGFDNFGFTVPAAPSPTPTPSASPTPTPPSAPTNVKATPDEEEIFVSWTPSQGAGWYIVKRTEAAAVSTNAAVPESLAFSPIAPSFYCQPINGQCFYPDTTAVDSDILYSYVVAAANSVGTSADSNPTDPVKRLPKPGCNASTTPAPAEGSRSRNGWLLNYSFSAGDGLVVSNVSLNGRLMAERMSVPYYEITAYNSSDPNHFPRTRGQLRVNGSNPDSSLHSTLVGYQINPPDPNKLLLEATYKIDHIPGAPRACLLSGTNSIAKDLGLANRVRRCPARDSVRW